MQDPNAFRRLALEILIMAMLTAALMCAMLLQPGNAAAPAGVRAETRP